MMFKVSGAQARLLPFKSNKPEKQIENLGNAKPSDVNDRVRPCFTTFPFTSFKI